MHDWLWVLVLVFVEEPATLFLKKTCVFISSVPECKETASAESTESSILIMNLMPVCRFFPVFVPASLPLGNQVHYLETYYGYGSFPGTEVI